MKCDTLTPLEHLILSIFPGDGGSGLMGFTLYFDDSGTHDESSTAIAACFVSTVEQWKDFEKAWKKISDEEKFGVFHMAEFAARQGQFVGWTDERRHTVLNRLCDTIDAHVYAGFAFGVKKKDYDELTSDSLRLLIGRFHYTFVLRQSIGSMGQWRKAYYPNSCLKYVFDQMGKGKHEIVTVMDIALAKAQAESISTATPSIFDGYSFDSRANLVPLQAADIFAWTTFQQMQVIAAGRKLNWVASLAFERLSGFTAKMSMSHFTRDALRNWLEAEETALVSRWNAQYERSGDIVES
jgi:hypothetical protein